MFLSLWEQMPKTPISSLEPFVVKDGCGRNHPTRASMEKWTLNEDDDDDDTHIRTYAFYLVTL